MTDTVNLVDKFTAFEEGFRVEFRDEVVYKIHMQLAVVNYMLDYWFLFWKKVFGTKYLLLFK